MRILIAVLLVAGAAWAMMPIDGTYAIHIEGNDAGYFAVTYSWYEKVDGFTGFNMIGVGNIVYRSATFRVQSLTEVLPTPDAMRAAGKAVPESEER